MAFTITGLCRPSSFRMSLIGLSRRSLSPRQRETWVCVEDGRIRGLASIRQRSGPRSWEISQLYADSDSDQAVVRLLEMAAVGAGSHGGERVFLRVETDSPTIRLARLAGYYPSHRETGYRGTAGRPGPSNSLFDADSRLRQRRSEDDYALFRLYNSATPVKVRQLVGMTFDQWASSYEHGPGRQYETVLHVDGEVRGWLSTAARFGTGSLAIRLHPDYDALTSDVVEAGLRRLKGTRTVIAIAEEYNPRLETALERLGFEAHGEYVVLVKSVARRVRERTPARSSQAAVE